jgi:hypothetical protein
MHYKLAEKVIGSTGLRQQRLCEALGGRALVQTSRGMHDEAMALLEASVTAAETYGSPADSARWLSHLAGVHRKMKSLEKSRETILRARLVLSGQSTMLAEILGAPELVRVMANLEGEAALLASAHGPTARRGASSASSFKSITSASIARSQPEKLLLPLHPYARRHSAQPNRAHVKTKTR